MSCNKSKRPISNIHASNISIVLAFAVLIHTAGCATTRQEVQLQALQKKIADLRIEVANCRNDIHTLRNEQKDLLTQLTQSQKIAIRNLMDELVTSSVKFLKRHKTQDLKFGTSVTGGEENKQLRSKKHYKYLVRASDFDASRWVKKVGKNRYHIARRGLTIVFSNPKILARSARIIPSLRNGNPAGFKLYAIRPNSFYHVLGLKSGDTIEQVNGIEILTPELAFNVYDQIKNARTIKLLVRRQNSLINLIYDVVPRI